MASRVTSSILSRLKDFIRYVILVSFIIVLCSPATYATHLVGGSMTYKYLGKSSKTGYYNYVVRIEMFRDCSNNNNIQFSTSIQPGVYVREVDTPKVDYYNYTGNITDPPIKKISEFSVSPPAAAKSCAFAPTTCIREGIYEDTIALPASNYGYYLYFATCCRNIMVNVPGVSEGQNYFAVIPPTNIVNSTPEFNAVPSPYICANDTVSLLYSASEPDGDSLVYILSQPYGGGSTGAGITAPPVWPGFIPVISYSPGYSASTPFGSTGFVKLDKTSGILTMYATITGRYALAVDVYEYRNKKEISVTRRDVQIIVISCPYRQAPKRVAIADSLPIDNGTPTSYSVEAGQRLSFNLRYEAQNAGIAVFSETGFFDKPNNLVKQPTFTYAIQGADITAYFNWQTTCKDASLSPYNFTVTVADTGCPPKTTYQGIKIYVNPFGGINNIYGPNPACQGITTDIYSTKLVPSGDTMIWKTVGGTFIRGTNDSSIEVTWGNISNGTIEALLKSQYGCGADTLSENISINPKPALPLITGPKNPCANIAEVYNAAGNAGDTFFWECHGGIITNMSGKAKTVSVKWFKADSIGYLSLSAQDTFGCHTDTAILKVNIAQPVDDSIYGSLSVCPNSSGIDYWTISQPGATYYWSVAGGNQVSGGKGSMITVDWGNQGGGNVNMYEVTSQGCIGTPLTLKVQKGYVLYTSPIVGDSSTCEYLKNVPYSVTKNTGSTYEWQISGGSIVSGSGSASILVDWDSAGPGALIVTETAYDSVNHEPCLGIPVNLLVNIHHSPYISQIDGPATLCEKDTAKFSVSGVQGASYLWKINGTTNQNHTDTLTLVDTGFANPTDILHISVVETSNYGCESIERDTVATVYKLPLASSISGPTKVCPPNLKNATYEVNGLPASMYNWTVDGGTIISGNNTNKIAVDWTEAGNKTVEIQKINQIGCAGPLNALDVKVDSLALEMQLVTTNKANDKAIDLFWLPRNNLFFNGYYKIYRESDNQTYFGLIDSLADSYSYYEDKNVNTALYSYRYKVSATNSCGTSVATDVHQSVKLSGIFDGDSTIRLNWNPYEGWPVNGYNINYSLNDDTAQTFYGLTEDTSYSVIKTFDGYKQCMRIMAKESGANNFVSLSNIICMDFDPIIWIPNIFTPNNGDDINNTFRIFVGNYKSFLLDIYNRWGEHIFSSSDPTIQWDGTYRGKDCVEGIYLYMLTVNGAKENIYRSGTVQLER